MAIATGAITAIWNVSRARTIAYRKDSRFMAQSYVERTIGTSGHCNQSVGVCFAGRTDSTSLLLADAEAREYPPEQVVARHLAGDFAERALRQAQLLRE